MPQLKPRIGKNNKLKELRKNNKWTQAYMAERLGITQQRYQQMENGKDLRGLNIIKICQEFDVSADWLLGLKE